MDEACFDSMVCKGLSARWPGGQAIVVKAASAVSADAEMHLYERRGGGWARAAGPWPALVGRNGVGKAREGDGKSPSGAFLLGAAFGRLRKPEGSAWPYRELDGRDRWVEEAGSPFYNRWVRGPRAACGGAEELREIMQYTHALAVRYNDACEPGRGSAILLHPWRRPDEGTQGCTAVSEENAAALLRWLEYGKRPVLAQGTEEELPRLMGEDWGMLCLPPGWGFVDDFLPDAQTELRYNADDNFTGRRLPGYRANAAPMRLEAIRALSCAAEELRRRRFGIRVYDAYRPQRSTDAMIAWAEDASDTATKAAYYPDIDKADIPHGFVARRSKHRLGGTVDLTLVDWGTGGNLDMGGPFDFFGELSGFAYPGISAAQAANRALLRSVMTASGFVPYDREWWHFTFPVPDDGGDFDILPREHAI
jgi:D-alanyl-D-alanine dipeptidase